MLRDAVDSPVDLTTDAESVFLLGPAAHLPCLFQPSPEEQAAAGIGRAVLQASSPWSIR